MAYRLLLDENVEHEVFHRLENYGHDVEHVDFVSELGKGTDDYPIAQYSREYLLALQADLPALGDGKTDRH